MESKTKVIIDVGKRWEDGIEHDPRSEKIVRFLVDYDFYWCGDSLQINCGGDGDNGETIMYILDEYFATEDQLTENKNG